MKAGNKNSVLLGKTFSYKSEIKLSNPMEPGIEVQEFNRNLYSCIEPYSSGCLKVSEIHTIYWEQSGNPNGHVSSHFCCFVFQFSSYFFVDIVVVLRVFVPI